MGKNYLRYGEFGVKAFLSLIIMFLGAGIFFSSDDNTMKLVGSNMATGVWASWMTVGFSKPSKKRKEKEEEETTEV